MGPRGQGGPCPRTDPRPGPPHSRLGPGPRLRVRPPAEPYRSRTRSCCERHRGSARRTCFETPNSRASRRVPGGVPQGTAGRGGRTLHVALRGPARVLRRVEAKRRVLARHVLSPAVGDPELPWDDRDDT
ncbi:DUF6221 family protein [Streptomyces liangshanensis]|uniref:DUF6221 family protein n=1 Tax=Streptomyces liangshanensis TaxID=2717324 RepID=UPI001FBB82E1|nr:DUF6221 family protein [Streptomyces liangshanensis]